jgi:hypothetical protein
MAKTKVSAEGSDEVVLTPEQMLVITKKIDSSLVKENVTDTLIQKYSDEYMELKIKGIEDKEGADIVYAARQTTKNTRILIKRICKEGREPAQAEAKAWITKEKELVEKVQVIEDHLQAQEDAYNNEINRVKQEKKDAEAARYRTRVMELQVMGAVNNGVEIVLDEVSYDCDVIKETDEDIYQVKILPKYKAIFDAKETIRLAKDKADQEAERIRQDQQIELARQQQALIDQQKEIDRQNQELEKKRFSAIQEQKNKRANELMALGLTYDFNYKSFVLRDVNVADVELATMDDQEWEILIKEITPVIADRKRTIQEEKDAEQDRLNKEAIEKADRERNEKAELARQKEREELEEGKDSDRWLFFLRSLPKEFPVMSSIQYQRMVADAQGKIEYIKSLKATRTGYKQTV